MPYLSVWPGNGHPAVDIFVQIEADHFVGGQEAVFDALLEGVGVDGLAEIVDIGDVFGLFGGGGQADLHGRWKVFENLAPGGIIGGAAAVTFVDDDQVEEVRRELLVDVLPLFGAGRRLGRARSRLHTTLSIWRLLDLGHRVAKMFEVVGLGLVDEDVAVGQKEDAFGLPGPP